MELEELLALKNDITELQKKIIAEKPERDSETYLKQLDPISHDVMDTSKRQNKMITTEENGVKGTATVEVARIPVSLQKTIVNRAASFLCGNPIQLMADTPEAAQEELLAAVVKTWEDNKLDYDSKRIAKIMKSETEVAELWYTEELEPNDAHWMGTKFEKAKYKLRMKILAPSLGDSLYPVYNSAGDMIAFGRGYSTLIEGKKTECFDLFTAEMIASYFKTDEGWAELVSPAPNMIKKIPVIYYEQEYPEWYDVQPMIDRIEKLLSNHADTNDYFGSPMIKAKGTVTGFSTKGESGKILEMSEGAEVDYLTWNQSPTSVELEFKNLRSLIFDLTDTPDISIEQMKSLGVFSGVALKMLFLGAHLKAADNEETFGKSIQRRINYIISALKVINLSYEKVLLTVKPKFEYFLPKNDQEKISMVNDAVSGGIMSTETAIKNNPLVEDAEAEKKLIEEEKAAAQKSEKDKLNDVMNDS